MNNIKRLIEIDLPIREISTHARREKSIRRGHISTLHTWWARRPLASCRSVVMGALLPDPGDPNCPPNFRKVVADELSQLRARIGGSHWNWNDPQELRKALLSFIATFADWKQSGDENFQQTAMNLVEAAHNALGGIGDQRPFLLDPFAGGGAIPLEGLRCGAEVVASDLNPIAILLNRVVLEYVPKYSHKLTKAIREEGAKIQEDIRKNLSELYPHYDNGEIPIAYLWARIIQCEGPGCGSEYPLLRSKWLCKRRNKRVALHFSTNIQLSQVSFEIINDSIDTREANRGTISRTGATCPICHYSMSLERVRIQLRARHGGTNDARLIAVVTGKPENPGRFYRLPSEQDLKAIEEAKLTAKSILEERTWEGIRLIPNESTEHYHPFVNRGPIYGMCTWADYFTPRQQVVLGQLHKLVQNIGEEYDDAEFAIAVRTCVGLALSRQVGATSSLCRWHTSRESHVATFGRQALPMVWDFSEVNVLSNVTGGFANAIEWVAKVCAENGSLSEGRSNVLFTSAITHPLPDNAIDIIVTDPPYYYSVQYADLADYFYVWMRRSLGPTFPELFSSPLIEKDDEIIVQSPSHENAKEGKNKDFYERKMREAFTEARRILTPNGVGVIVFAHKSTSAWEAQLQAMIDAGWIITASWPIDTEMSTRLLAQGRATLASSVHLVCRPREYINDMTDGNVGIWRDVLTELPKRMHEWMPHLSSEGIVGADAIFSCLGPALEIFSQYSRVEKTNGDVVSLREYLEHVWAEVAREALATVFKDADTSDLEADARISAMWLWTLFASNFSSSSSSEDKPEEVINDDVMQVATNLARFNLEYDTARKITQGLGANIDTLNSIIEIDADEGKARLLNVSERSRFLFDTSTNVRTTSQIPSERQGELLPELNETMAQTWGEIGAPISTETTLDRVHQAMLLFSTGRIDAMKRFLADEGASNQTRFWKLAQSLSALYPTGTDEKRWIDGVLARKKEFGFR